MVSFLIFSDDLKEALSTFLPFVNAERSRRIRKGNSGNLEENTAVRLDIFSDDMIARLSFGNRFYKVSTSIHCDSEGDISIMLDAAILFSIIKDIDEELEFILDDDYYLSNHCLEVKIAKNQYSIAYLLVSSKIVDFFKLPNLSIQFRIEKFSGNFLDSTLRDFSKLCNFYDGFDYSGQVWYVVNSDICRVTVTNNHLIKHKRYHLKSDVVGSFDIIKDIAHPIADLVKGKNVVITRYPNACVLYSGGIMVEMESNKSSKLRPSVINFMTNIQFTTKLIINKFDLEKYFNTLHRKYQHTHFVYFHPINDYVFLHNIDNDMKICESIYIPNFIGESHGMFKLSISYIERILSCVNGNRILIEYGSSKAINVVSISDEDEPYSLDNAQLIATAMFDDDISQIQQSESFQIKEITKKDPSYLIKMETFQIGAVFTRHIIPNDTSDHLIPFITAFGVDVVVMLGSISSTEKNAFSVKPIKLALYSTKTLPFITMDFDGVFIQQFALNMMSMNETDRNVWLNDTKIRYFRLFLVDANTHKLTAIRIFTPTLMKDIKMICSNQTSYNSDKINEFIEKTEQVLSIHEIYEFANKTEIISSPDINL